MSLSAQSGRRVAADMSISELIEQWMDEQVGRAGAGVRARPRIGLVAASGVLRDDPFLTYQGEEWGKGGENRCRARNRRGYRSYCER